MTNQSLALVEYEAIAIIFVAIWISPFGLPRQRRNPPKPATASRTFRYRVFYYTLTDASEITHSYGLTLILLMIRFRSYFQNDSHLCVRIF